MPKIVKPELIASDSWRLLSLLDHDSPLSVRLPVGPLLVPTTVWRARRAELIMRECEHGWPVGVWLGAGETPEDIAGDLDDLALIAVTVSRESEPQLQFAAGLLRRRGYAGQLVAVGEVPRERVSPLYASEIEAGERALDDAGHGRFAGNAIISPRLITDHALSSPRASI